MEVVEQTQAEPVSIESRISSYVASEDDPPPDEVEESPQESEESDVEIQADADEAPQEEEEIEFTWNGEQVRKKKSEAIELARQGFDYTQKTQALAEARKRFEADVQSMQQTSAMQSALQEQFAEVKAIDRQLEQFKSVNWHELAEQDPVQYLKINQTYRDLKETRETKIQEVQGLGNELQQKQAEHMSQVLAREARALENAIPDFRGEKKSESVAALRSYLAESGYNDNEIAGAVDHRAVTMAWKAMQYDKIQKSKPADKKVQNLPKPIKPGMSPAKGQVQAEKSQQMRQQLRKTGKIPPGLLSRFI